MITMITKGTIIGEEILWRTASDGEKQRRKSSFILEGRQFSESDKHYQNWEEHERYFVRTLNRLGRNIKTETRNVYHLRK